jgi:hypothetical protein
MENNYTEFYMRCQTGVDVRNPYLNVVPQYIIPTIELIEVDNPKWIRGILWRIMFGFLYVLAVIVTLVFIIGMVIWINTPFMGIAAAYTGFQICRLLFLMISSWIEFGKFPSYKRKLLIIKEHYES